MVQPIPPRPAGSARTFLFLQGLASPFFARLGEAIRQEGHQVLRINLALGDRVFWRGPAADYRGTLAGWRKYLVTYLRRHAVTDIVLFGDCRPYHRIAIGLARRSRIQVHVFEEGYVRPYWITVEPGGVNGHSSLPRDPDAIRAIAEGLPEPVETTFPGHFRRRALWDVAYNVAMMMGRPFYPGYHRHRPHHILVEYGAWLRKFARRGAIERHAAREVERAAARPGSYVLLPLQLGSDYQIRIHSRFADLSDFLEEVVASFARHAPPEIALLVKVHPLDPGLVDRRAQIDALAARHGVIGRTSVIEAGHLPTLLSAARGVVVVNSTVGTTALETGLPTIALGTAIYDVPGLTFQHGLDRFWTEGRPPDPDLFRAFRRLVLHRTQVNGSFFSPEGIAMSVGAAAGRVLSAASVTGRTRREERGEAADERFAARAQPAE